MREDEGGRQWDARTSKRWYAGTFMRANDHARFARFWGVKVLSFVMASSAMSEKRWPVVLCERPGRVAQVLRVELGHPLRGLVDDGAEDLEAMGFGDGEMGGYPREVGEVAGLELRWCALQQARCRLKAATRTEGPSRQMMRYLKTPW